MLKKTVNSQYVIFTLGQQKYGLEVMDSREIINTDNLTLIPDSPSFVEGVIKLRDQIIPIINLSKKFNLNIKIENNKIIIIAIKNELIGLMVEEVVGIYNLDQQDISDTPEITKRIDSNYISGITNLNEELIIIIESKSILENQELEEIKSIDI